MAVLNNVKVKLCAVLMFMLALTFSFGMVSNAASSEESEAVSTSADSSTKLVSASTKVVRITRMENMAKGIKLRWSKANGVSGYYVYRKSEDEDKYKKIKTIEGDSTLTYKDASVAGTTGTAYKYKVVPFTSHDKAKGTGTSSKIVRVDTPVLKGSLNISSSINSDGETSRIISLSWKKVKKASGYRVFMYPADGDPDDAVTYKLSGAYNNTWSLNVTDLHGDYRIYVQTLKKKGGKTYRSAASEEVSYSRP